MGGGGGWGVLGLMGFKRSRIGKGKGGVLTGGMISLRNGAIALAIYLGFGPPIRF